MARPEHRTRLWSRVHTHKSPCLLFDASPGPGSAPRERRTLGFPGIPWMLGGALGERTSRAQGQRPAAPLEAVAAARFMKVLAMASLTITVVIFIN